MQRLSSLWKEFCTRTDYEKCERPRAARFSNQGIRDLLQRMGNPHYKYDSLLVAGSKGKGSVAHFMALGLQGAGFKTGVYNSPHLSDWRERILVQQQFASDFRLAAAMERVLAAAGGDETFFDLLTATAFAVYAEEKCDVAVVEVGLGGRFDSTNVLEPVASVVTSVEMEHVDVLGPDLESIAWNKAGILKTHSQAWTGSGLPPAARAVLRREADEQAVRLMGPTPSGREHIGHPQPHMQSNFDLAHSVLNANSDRWPGAASALLALPAEELVMPGRWERRQLADGRNVVFDVAHSAHSLLAVIRAFRQAFPEQQRGIAMALRDDKNAAELAHDLAAGLEQVDLANALASHPPSSQSQQEQWFTMPAGDHPRSADPQLVASALSAAGLPAQAMAEVAFPSACDVLLITGSTYLVGALRGETQP
jgi:dihydrofolate synthase / folylpolyglutamate synthase